MILIESLRSECIQIGSAARNKGEALQEVARLAKRCRLLDPFSEETIFRGLEAREETGSTGFGEGIAVPHCTLVGLKEFVVGLLLAPKGVDFASQDGASARALFFIIGPPDRRGEHIQILSSISKLLKRPGAADELIKAREKQGLMELIFKLDQYQEGVKPRKRRSLFLVWIQREDVFLDILQILSSSASGSIAILEGRGAGESLERIPIFSALLKESGRKPIRILQAVVDSDLCNDLIRRIHLLREDLEGSAGVVIAVQDLAYSCGFLEY